MIVITVQQYQCITGPLRRHPALLRGMMLVNRLMTVSIYAAYPLLLVCLLLRRDPRFWHVLLVPGISFILLSLLRDHINAPRPYEKLNITPLIHKDTKGHSFPSRHVFSAAVISTAFLYCGCMLGAIFLVFSLLLAFIRVLGGVHFPRDVLAGLLMGLGSGVVGFVFF